MKYRILSSDSQDDLENQVEQYLKEGWQLHGFLIVKRFGHNNNDVCYYQAVTEVLS